MRFVIFLGMPGAGKGTQCRLLSERDGIISLSPGEIIRTKLSQDKEIAEIVNKGDLLSDLFIMNLVDGHLNGLMKTNNDAELRRRDDDSDLRRRDSP